MGPLFDGKNSLYAGTIEKVMNIDCTDPYYIKITSNTVTPIADCKKISTGEASNMEEATIAKIDGSLEFTLVAREYNQVEYRGGQLLLIVPKELENYKVGNQNLLNIILEYFQIFYEKIFGSSIEVVQKDNAIEVKSDLGKPLSHLNHLKIEPTIKTMHNFKTPIAG